MKVAQVASEPEGLMHRTQEKVGKTAAVGVGAGPSSQRLLLGLTAADLDVVLMEIRRLKGALKAMPIKTDRRDAEGIAWLLDLRWSRRVHCKFGWAQEVSTCPKIKRSVTAGGNHRRCTGAAVASTDTPMPSDPDPPLYRENSSGCAPDISGRSVSILRRCTRIAASAWAASRRANASTIARCWSITAL